MAGYYYHYTEKDFREFAMLGIFSGSSFTTDEYYQPVEASMRLGIPHPLWVLKFRDDGKFKKLDGGFVRASNKYPVGGGSQFTNPGRIKPVAYRKINSGNWILI